MHARQPAIAVFRERKSFNFPFPRCTTCTNPLTHAIHPSLIVCTAVHIHQRGKVGEKCSMGGSKKIRDVIHV